MVWMETYFFYYTVRLGVVVIGVLTLLELFIPDVLLLALGIQIVAPIIELFQNDEHYNKNAVVVRLIHYIENQPQNALICMHVYLFTHMATCLLAIFGALKLKKWLLVPFAVFEFVRIFYSLTWHIVLMIMLKKILSLGILIAYTLAGGFLILYLGYNWAASVALFQIITLIHSDRYVALYGVDPFKPLLPPSTKKAAPPAFGTVENVRVIVTPKENDIDEQKYRNVRAANRKLAPPPIISVLPANYNNDNNRNNNNRDDDARIPVIIGMKKHQHRWWQQAPHPQRLQTPNYTNDEYSMDYGNWQWAELVVGWPKKRNNGLITRKY